jgi:peptidoglycan/xylan/chitin deacetylase (PgdA/CDA1 family)
MIRRAAYRINAAASPLFSRLSTPVRVGILMGHGVYDEISDHDLAPPRSSVSLRSLETNIRSLARAYDFVSMDEAVDILTGRRNTPKPCLALTFDDSLKCHVTVTAPRLVKLGIPATFYLSTKVIDEEKSYWWVRLEEALANSDGETVSIELPGEKKIAVSTKDRESARRTLTSTIRSAVTPEKCDAVIDSIEDQLDVRGKASKRRSSQGEILTWEDARKLKELGMTLGGHTESHANLTLLEGAALKREFTVCRDALSKNTGDCGGHFCYPHGFHSENVRKTAEELGFRSGVTIDPGWSFCGDSLFALKRFAIPARDYELPWTLSSLRSAVGRLRGSGKAAVMGA